MKYHIGNQRCFSFQDGGMFLYKAHYVFVIASKVLLEVERMYSEWPFEQFLHSFRYEVISFYTLQRTLLKRPRKLCEDY